MDRADRVEELLDKCSQENNELRMETIELQERVRELEGASIDSTNEVRDLKREVSFLRGEDEFPKIDTIDQSISAVFDEGFITLEAGKMLAQEVIDLTAERRMLRKGATANAVKICDKCPSKGLCSGVDWDCVDLLLALATQEEGVEG